MEIELKYALENSEQYAALIHYLSEKTGEKAQILQQDNSFFDTANGDLRNAGLILRLRKENDAFWLTAKGAAPQDVTGQGTLSNRLEEETQIKTEEAQKALQGEVDLLQMFEASPWPASAQEQKDRLVMIAALKKAQNKKQIAKVGAFKNIRRVFEITIQNKTYKIECDETHFPGDHIDYEMEIELQNTNEASDVTLHAEHWLAQLDIPIKSAKGKASRFFAHLALTQTT